MSRSSPRSDIFYIEILLSVRMKCYVFSSSSFMIRYLPQFFFLYILFFLFSFQFFPFSLFLPSSAFLSHLEHYKLIKGFDSLRHRACMVALTNLGTGERYKSLFSLSICQSGREQLTK